VASFAGGQNLMRVGSGERRGLINLGERADSLQRHGSTPWARTNLMREDLAIHRVS
jgi:hypothetical protein